MALLSRPIKDELVRLLKLAKYKGEDAFTDVKGHPRGEFDSYPSVQVLPGEQLDNKASMGQNDRAPQYIVRTHVKAKDDGSEFDHMYDLTDLIMDTLDEADWDNALELPEGAPTAWILNTTRGDWFETDSPAGALLMCDINVEVKYSQDL